MKLLSLITSLFIAQSVMAWSVDYCRDASGEYSLTKKQDHLQFPTIVNNERMLETIENPYIYKKEKQFFEVKETERVELTSVDNSAGCTTDGHYIYAAKFELKTVNGNQFPEGTLFTNKDRNLIEVRMICRVDYGHTQSFGCD